MQKYSTREDMNHQSFNSHVGWCKIKTSPMYMAANFYCGIFIESCGGMEGWGRAGPETSKRLHKVSYSS